MIVKQVFSITESRNGEIKNYNTFQRHKGALEEVMRTNLGPRAALRELVKLEDI